MAHSRKRSWSDLSTRQRRGILGGSAVEAVVTLVALRDLARRPAGDVHGPKAAWVASFVVQPFGPLAYLLLGRRSA